MSRTRLFPRPIGSLSTALTAVFAASAAFVAAAPAAFAQAFRCDFNDPNRAGPNLYCFANRYPQSATTWETTHRPTGGWGGSGAPHVTVHGCAPGPGCNTSEHQFNTGWSTPALGGAPRLGDARFVRFRIRFDDDQRLPSSGFNAKFILYGQTRTEPNNSRWIIHLFHAMANGGCTLGFDYRPMGWMPARGEWTTHRDWGLASDFDRAPTEGLYAGFVPNVNISWSCAPAVLVTRGNHPDPVPQPQRLGARPVSGWYHLQFEAVSGNAGAADFRVWANNNDRANPSSERLDMPEGLGVVGWDQGVDVGGYWGIATPHDIGYVIDDFEVGPDFDPRWYPGGAVTPPPDAGSVTPPDAATPAADASALAPDSGGAPSDSGAVAPRDSNVMGDAGTNGGAPSGCQCGVAGSPRSRRGLAPGLGIVFGVGSVLRRRRTAAGRAPTRPGR